jgi:two-component system CheB/CheR fusion protein
MSKRTEQGQAKTPAKISSGASPQAPAPDSGFPVVGIGASAEGVAAFEAFFSAMPADNAPDMAFVIVSK